MSKAKVKIPSILSFERKLECSDGLMYSGNWDDREDMRETSKEINGELLKTKIKNWKTIPIVPRQNRSTQSAYGIDDIKKTAPNPVSSDSDDANLPFDKDTLKLNFSMRVIGNLGKPFACNMPDFAAAIEDKVSAFKKTNGIDDIATRYAYNIANGRFLWRNRVCAEEIEIRVSKNDEQPILIFNPYEYSLKDFNTKIEHENLKKLAEGIKQCLIGEDDKNFLILKVEAFVKLGQGQHVFPSQEMNIGAKKKKLFQLDGCGAMHNVKIGNAIRTIDNWYGSKMLVKTGKSKTDTIDIPEALKGLPIAIEPFGSVTQHGRAYRHKDIDLYSLLENWVNGDIESDQKKYVVANLIRGGVFGGESEG